MPRWKHIGVDWDSGEWLAVGISDADEFGVDIYERMRTLWTEVGSDAARIVVDVPIGLCGSTDRPEGCIEDADEEIFRECDALARDVIGSRSSSVFNPPCRSVIRDAVDEDTYEVKDDVYDDINGRNKDCTGKGLMQQALYIAPGIVEVEDLLRDVDPDSETILEGHPEVCFRAFAGETDLDYSKHTAPGVAERLELLEGIDPCRNDTWRELASDLADEGHSAGMDDVLDALALALTAAARDDELHRLPPDPPEDAEDLPMQMVYRRESAFELED